MSRSDQIKLIKQGSFEVTSIRFMHMYDEEGMYVPSMEFKVPLQALPKMPMGNLFVRQHAFAQGFNRLKLTDAEIGLFSTIMIVSAGALAIHGSASSKGF